jgi:hypothetical protein
VFVANITNKFIFRLDFQPSCGVFINLGCETLRLAEEVVLLWSPRAEPRPSSLVVANDLVIPAKSEDVVMIRLERPLGVESGLIEPSPLAHQPEGST